MDFCKWILYPLLGILQEMDKDVEDTRQDVRTQRKGTWICCIMATCLLSWLLVGGSCLLALTFNISV